MLAEKLTDEQISLLMQQHAELIIQIDRIWTALIVASFVGLIFILLMLFVAAWSVSKVNIRQDRTDQQILELAGKFTLLIDVLLEGERRKRGESTGTESI